MSATAPAGRAFLDTSDAGYLSDPHSILDELRAEDWCVADSIGFSLLTYDACEAAFHDTSMVPGIDWLLTDLGHGPLWGTFGHSLADSEDGDHRRLRRTVSPWFTAKRISRLREQTADLVDDLLDEHDPSEPIEVMSQLADIVPSKLFCWMVGADPAHAELLARWSKVLLLVFTGEPSMVEPVRAAKHELLAYTQELLDTKREQPADDLASVLAQAADRGEISTADAVYLLEELLSASVDNTANTTGLAVHTLAEHPQAWATLHDDHNAVPAAVEECGRYQPAIRHTIKYVTDDTSLLGRRFHAGSYVTIRVAAAHRDPAVYDAPHTFDISRDPPKPQLAFGAGRHYCLGAALGKMEVQEMIAGLTRRWRDVCVADVGTEMSVAASGHVQTLRLEIER